MENNIRVYLRIRPSLERPCLEQVSSTTVRTLNTQQQDVYTFDAVAGPHPQQPQEIFSQLAKAMSEECLAGYNATIFAYGQTGSGKTYTMQGASERSEITGLIPQCFFNLFHGPACPNNIEGSGNEQDKWETTIKCSFVEIYNEMLYDLLEGVEQQRILREDVKRSVVYVEGVREELVRSATDALAVFEKGTANRHVAETRMNRESSRSHSVFTLYLTRKRFVNGLEEVRESRFNLVDLAGSERQQSTGSVGVRLKEAGNINKSLLALSNVINSLSDCTDPLASNHIQYRDSKLTFLLRDSLGGNSRTVVIACVSPAWTCQGETVSTLRFAQRAKTIRNRAVVNQGMRGSAEDLETEIRRLQSEVLRLQGIGQSACTCLTEPGDELVGKLLERTRKQEKHLESLAMRCTALEELGKRREQQSNSERLILKFRDRAIQALQSHQSPEYKDALTEVEEIRRLLENPPQVALVLAEKAGLQERIAQLESLEAQCDPLYVQSLEARLCLEPVSRVGVQTQSEIEMIPIAVDTGDDPMIKQLQSALDNVNTALLRQQDLQEKCKKLEFLLLNAQQDNEHLLSKLSSQPQDLTLRLAELHSQNESLRHENDKLVQHHNLKQKLQYHVKIKQENNELKEELALVKEELYRLKHTSNTN